MKIAIVVSDLSNGAGTERAVSNLANLLCSKEYKVTLVSSQTSSGSYYKLDERVSTVHLNLKCSAGVAKRGYYYWKMIKELRRLVRVRKLDYILGTTHAINSLLPFVALKNERVRSIGCEHLSFGAAPWFSNLFRKILYPLLDRLVVLTKADALNYGFMKSKVSVIPNSLSFFNIQPAKLVNKQIIAVGRLTSQKGFDLLLLAAAKLKLRAADWKIVVVGDGEQREELVKQKENLGLVDYVEFMPASPEIIMYYLNSSIYVMSSRWEGLPMVLLEALSCGLPIVSFDCPEGPAEIIKDGYNGFLVKPLDTDELANRLHTLIVNQDLRSEMGRNSLEVADTYRPDNILKKWNSIFK